MRSGEEKIGRGKWSNRNGDEGYWKVAVGEAETQTKIPQNTYTKSRCKRSPKTTKTPWMSRIT